MDIEKEFAETFKEEIVLNEMKWEVGGVYHQDYKNGDKTYFRADSVQKNKRWKGKSVDEIGGKQKKPKNNTADERVQGWETTPKNEIPKALKEAVKLNDVIKEIVDVETEAKLKKQKKKDKDDFAFGISKKGGHGVGKGYRLKEVEEKKSATGYELYHKTFSGAMQHAYKFAKSKGFIVDPKEIDDKVATGPKKPSSGKTNRYSLKAGRKKVEIQVANLDNKRYELNMYIEGVLQELPAICGMSADERHSETMKKAYAANGCVEKKKKDRELFHKDLQKVYDKYGKETKESKKLKIKGEENMKDLITAAREILMGEDTDPDKPGKQGDAKEYQKKRTEILKGYGVKACGLIKDEKEKKQCFQDLDDAHVSDEEEKEKKETWLPKKAKLPKETKGLVHTPAETEEIDLKKKVGEGKTYLKLNLKKLKKQYEKNEDKNNHTENYLLLAKSFGTSAEVKKVQEILKRNQKEGSTSKVDNDWMYKNINPYYDKIRNESVVVSESFWKVNISDMPVIFIETSSKSEIIKDMRKKLKPDVFKDLSIERVTKAEMVKTYRKLVKGEGGDDEVKEILQHSQKILDEHCGVCGEQGFEESTALQLKMAFDDAKIKIKGVKGGKLVIAKKDKKKAIDVISKSLKKGSDAKKVVDSQIQFEEVEDSVDPNPEKSISKLFSHVKGLMKGK